MHTTNYRASFIAIAPDSALTLSRVPVAKNDKPSIARMQYDRLVGMPYHWTSDDLLFDIYAERQGLDKSDENFAQFFSKGQPCLRTSPLAKTHGFGFHFDADEKVAIYGVETADYARLSQDANVKQIVAMRSKRG